MTAKRSDLSRNARLDVVTARAWNRTIRRLDQTRANRQWNRMDTLAVQALRFYVRLVRETGADVQMRLEL